MFLFSDISIQKDKLNKTFSEIAELVASNENTSTWEKRLKKNFVNDDNRNQTIAAIH